MIGTVQCSNQEQFDQMEQSHNWDHEKYIFDCQLEVGPTLCKIPSIAWVRAREADAISTSLCDRQELFQNGFHHSSTAN